MTKIRMWNKEKDIIEDLTYPFFMDGDGDIVDVRTFKKIKGWIAVSMYWPKPLAIMV